VCVCVCVKVEERTASFITAVNIQVNILSHCLRNNFILSNELNVFWMNDHTVRIRDVYSYTMQMNGWNYKITHIQCQKFCYVGR